MHYQMQLNELNALLAEWVVMVKGTSAAQLYDLNKLSENVVMELLKLLLDMRNLRNLNAEEKQNFPAIDLADDGLRIAIQITSTPTINKVKETLRKFIGHELNKRFDRLIVYVITEKQSRYDQNVIETVIQGRMNFDATTDILDFKSLMKVASSHQPNVIKAAVGVLKKHLHGDHEDEIPHWLQLYERKYDATAPFTPPWFIFAERAIELVGREHELAKLDQFLNSKKKFSWWVVAGPAGIGKSRLAHEVVLKHRRHWDCGFLSLRHVDDAIRTLKIARRPSFFVVDYASRNMHALITLLSACCAINERASYPIRLLILERSVDSSADWWTDLVGVGSTAGSLRMQHLHNPPSASLLSRREYVQNISIMDRSRVTRSTQENLAKS